MDSDERGQREEVLRRAVLAGDERAWEAWYRDSFDELYTYVLWRLGGRRDLADEVVQETWLTAVRRVRRFDPRQGRFLDWLRDLAGNVVRHSLREQTRRWKREQAAQRAVPAGLPRVPRFWPRRWSRPPSPRPAHVLGSFENRESETIAPANYPVTKRRWVAWNAKQTGPRFRE
jgi:DNA-directed RNA polymerase specialized sigma24 family protein